MITDYTNKALEELDAIKGNKIDKQYLVEFAENLIGRTK